MQDNNQNLPNKVQQKKETQQVSDEKQQRFWIWYVHEKMNACTHFKGNIDNETNKSSNKSKKESATNNELRSATRKQIAGYNLQKKEQQNKRKQRAKNSAKKSKQVVGSSQVRKHR